MVNVLYKTNCFYEIKKIKPTSQNYYRKKLMAMGLLPGTRFKIKRVASFGGPIQLDINGNQISVRPHELNSLLEVALIEDLNQL